MKADHRVRAGFVDSIWSMRTRWLASLALFMEDQENGRSMTRASWMNQIASTHYLRNGRWFHYTYSTKRILSRLLGLIVASSHMAQTQQLGKVNNR